MRRLWLSLFLWLLSLTTWAQFGNEWVQTGQEYWKIQTGRDGIYRLTYEKLQAAGFPVAGVDPQQVQIYHRGVQQAILVTGDQDGTFDPGDFIEFYGRRNDGTLDRSLYEPVTAQPNPYTNLFSDTTAFFLTVGPSSGVRMPLVDLPDPGTLTPESYHTHEELTLHTNQYSQGQVELEYLRNTAFQEGEGWTGPTVRDGNVGTYVISNLEGMSTLGSSSLEVLVAGLNLGAHPVEIWVGPSASSLRLLVSGSFTNLGALKLQAPISIADVSGTGQMTVQLVPKSTGVGSNLASLSYIKISIAQALNAGARAEKHFHLQPNANGISKIQIAQPAPGARLFDVTNPDTPRVISTVSNTTLDAIVSDSHEQRDLFLTSQVIEPAIRKVTLPAILQGAANYLIISHPLLRQPVNEYADPVRAYAAYRASAQGGSYDTLVIDITKLYDLFSYGEVTPLAIRNFLRWMSEVKTPDYLFLIGKGLTPNYGYERKPAGFINYKNLVPPAGMPGSDTYYSVGIDGHTHEPAIPTGRLTAMLPWQVANYLDKVKETESLPYNSLWRKKIMHLSGGIRAGEPQLFKLYMEGFQLTAEDIYYGGKVTHIAKQSTDLEFINISDAVNQGLSLITFFGHSSPGTIDFDIGFVSDPLLGYNNKGKYPMFLINGCNAGAFFLNDYLFGEDWIFTKDKGSVGFIAHAGYGLEYTLRRYSDIFYEVAYADSVFIRSGIGDIQAETAARYMTDGDPTIANVSQVQQMMLIGDPAVRLFGAAKPDYALEVTDVFVDSFDGNAIHAQSDSLQLTAIIRNYGQARGDSLHVRLTHRFPDNTEVVFDTLIPPVLYMDTVMFTIRKDRNPLGGSNRFIVTLDAFELRSELNEENNTAEIEFSVPLNATRNLFPFDHAVVTTQEQTLRFQTTDLLSGDREFVVEWDTTYTFDSPWKGSANVTGRTIGMHAIELLATDSMVYYWRTRLAVPLPDESNEWTWNSFVYIDGGNEGWAQADFAQYLKNEMNGFVRDMGAEELRFEETVTDVSIKTFGGSVSATNLQVSIKLNGSEYQLPFKAVTQRVPCRRNTINMIAFDKVTTRPYPAIDYGFQNPRTCGKEPQVIGSFLSTELETPGFTIAEYINNIAEGDSVVLFSIGTMNYSAWPAGVKSSMEQLGLSTAQINSLTSSEPIIVYGKKGSTPGSAILFRTDQTPPASQWLEVAGTITGRRTSAEMKSAILGPASEWKQLDMKVSEVEPQDEWTVSVTGIGLDGDKATLLTDVPLHTSLASIDADAYPYLQLHFEAGDELNLTSPQLRHWFVEYESVPEGILMYSGNTSGVRLAEGQELNADFGFVNISDKAFTDSLLVRHELFNTSIRVPDEKSVRIKAPAPGDTTHFTLSFQTLGKVGLNDLNVFVNPRVLPEQYYDNNSLSLIKHVDVQADRYRPVLDVTFDGRRLKDYDFVSRSPVIDIKVWDENRFILLSDTTALKMYIRYPCALADCPLVPIYFSNERVEWYAATDTEDFRVYLRPEFAVTGEYALQLEAFDQNGNPSGSDPYIIHFIISDEQQVVLRPPHPNPANRFIVFDLAIAGGEAPDKIVIDVIGTDGRNVVSLEAQSVHVGNIEMIWNLKDSAGRDMPSGVYIYKLSVFQNGSLIPVSIPFGGSYFANGYGKIMILK